jgi:hypothetical protein
MVHRDCQRIVQLLRDAMPGSPGRNPTEKRRPQVKRQPAAADNRRIRLQGEEDAVSHLATSQVTLRPPNPWPWIALSVAILAIAAVSLVFMLTSDTSDRASRTDHRELIERVIDPVSSANYGLSEDLGALDADGAPDTAMRSTRTALWRTRQARDELHDVDLPSEAGRLQLDTERALGRELNYLLGVRRALHSSHSIAGVRTRAARARAAWRTVALEIPGAGGRIAGFNTLVSWARAVPVLEDGDAGVGAAQPVLEDGDAGPGDTSSVPADDVQGAPDAPSVRDCPGFQGVFDIVATGISCQEAGDVAIGAIKSKSAAGANGYICTPTPGGDGSTRFTCDGPAGEGVSFSAFVG